ncbi:hypothetical protein GCM10010300_58710 [Streptomyces olivaceoviridis]|uniref:hypothetical protein n=1 Tax=Streptomyces olivaceoviridis TaxID=1921 RepID=UPI001673297E|nr:hypothetical protein [Streptomyces olivaceoviridis]GGZ07097.1 hypothetical protein GCM10010300_58710 [Streptomyces olivaceoviridis]
MRDKLAGLFGMAAVALVFALGAAAQHNAAADRPAGHHVTAENQGPTVITASSAG